MKIHEYQAKEILARYGVAVPFGRAATDGTEALAAARRVVEETNSDTVVVKAQIHAGGRGKGRFVEHPDLGGVTLVQTAETAADVARRMLGSTLVTVQTGPEGKNVQRVLIEQGLAIAKEFYAGVVVDRSSERCVMMVSTEGGTEIELTAARTPEKIVKEPIDPTLGFMAYQGRKLAWKLALDGKAARSAAECLTSLGRAFVDLDASLAEINPLVLTEDGRVIALDAKLNLDDNAAFRHKDREPLRDPSEEDPAEQEGRKWNLSYINMDGTIGCMVNGAGLAMATMDIIKYHGGEPANFLDVGGGARADQVAAAFKIITADPKVKGIFINIFGGIMRCDTIAEGVVQAVREVGLSVPLVVRLEGTNVELGREILAKSSLNIVSAANMQDGARKIVELTL